MRPNLVQYTGVLRIKYVEFVWKCTGEWYVFDTYQLHVKAMKYYCNIIIWMAMEKSKELIQLLVIFRQFGDVLSFFMHVGFAYILRHFYKVIIVWLSSEMISKKVFVQILKCFQNLPKTLKRKHYGTQS